jgi:endonuclease YncB( thermonuclease family)
MSFSRALISAAMLALPMLATAREPHEIVGKAVKIADGDTLTVLDGSNVQHKIRLAGIDAPEKAQLPSEPRRGRRSATKSSAKPSASR